MRTGIALCASALAAVLTSSAFAAPTIALPFGLAAKTKVNKSGFATITTKTKANAGFTENSWTVKSGSVDLVGQKYWQQPDGADYTVDLIGTTGVGSIQQTITGSRFVSGDEYQLSFDLSANPEEGKWKEGSVTKHLSVEIFSSNDMTHPLASNDYDLSKGSRTRQNMAWVESEISDLTFTYAGGNIVVRFSADPPASADMPKKAKATTLYCGPVIGNVGLTDLGGGNPVPEPMSLGILGVGASALLLKRRRGC